METSRLINAEKAQGYQSSVYVDEENATLLGSKTIQIKQEPESCSVTMTVKRLNWATVAGLVAIFLFAFSTLLYVTLPKTNDVVILGTPAPTLRENLKKNLPEGFSPEGWICCANYAVAKYAGWKCCLDKDNNEVQPYNSNYMHCCSGGVGNVVYQGGQHDGACDDGPYKSFVPGTAPVMCT
jgi:hypothetical protein